MYDPVNDEPRECANIKRNLRQLSERRASEMAEKRNANRRLERRRAEADAARGDLDLAKQRAKAGKRGERQPGRRASRRDMLQQGAELIEEVAETFLRDWTRRSRRADARLRNAEEELAEAERRLDETQRLLDQSERAFERFGCRGTITSYRYWG